LPILGGALLQYAKLSSENWRARMPEMDQGIKWLVQHRPEDVLALALRDVEYLGPLQAEVAAPQLILDSLLHVRYQGVECAVDIEAEARPEPDIGSRLCDYAARVRGATGLQVISVVLWLQPHGAPPRSPYEMYVGDLLVGTWRYFGIEVYRLDADSLLSDGPKGLLPLVPFMHNGDNEALIERAARDIYTHAPVELRYDLESLLGTFGARVLGAPAMRAILGRLPMSLDLFRTSPLYQEVVEEVRQESLEKGRQEGLTEGRQEGLTEGRQEGLTEGRQEGHLESLRQVALSVLRQRFTTVPPEVEAAIAQADLATAEAVIEHVIADSLEQVRERLGLPAQ
jgi:predicted transposase YdaD